MKKLYYSILFAALVVAGCSKAPAKTDLEAMNLKGHVKQLSEFVFNAENTETEPDDSLEQKERTDYDLVRVIDFDTHGRATNIRSTSKDGSFSQRYVYDKDSILQGIECFKNGNLEMVKKYDYNIKGQVKSISNIDVKTNKEMFIRNFSYDKNGFIEKEEDVNEKGKVVGTIKNKYNSQGLLEESFAYGEKMEKKSGRKLTYNDKGFIVSVESLDDFFGNRNIKQDYKYKSYDEKGNWEGRIGICMGLIVENLERSYEYYD